MECSFAYCGQYATDSPSILHVTSNWLAMKHLNFHQVVRISTIHTYMCNIVMICENSHLSHPISSLSLPLSLPLFLPPSLFLSLSLSFSHSLSHGRASWKDASPCCMDHSCSFSPLSRCCLLLTPPPSLLCFTTPPCMLLNAPIHCPLSVRICSLSPC